MPPIDYSEYPQNWKTEIRPAVMKRAGEIRDEHGDILAHAKCEDCNVPNHSLIHRFGKGPRDYDFWPEGMESEAWSLDGKKCTKIVLTIAHLDNDKSNESVSLNRLKALCQKCHLGRDKNHHVANRKYGRKHGENNHKLDL